MPLPSHNIVDYELDELKAKFQDLGLENFRAQQVMDWVYRKGVYNLKNMSNLSEKHRQVIAQNFSFNIGKIKQRQSSEGDGSIKLLLELGDGELVEAVSIPKRKRRTVCLSSQVGCKFKCGFCASGQAGFFRNLSAGEMIAQVLRVRDLSSQPLTNLVFMGIGEPLDNYDNLLKAIRFLNSTEQFGMGARRITISTCGVVPKIKRLAKEGLQIELSVSLHGATDQTREKLMPVNRRWPIKKLLEACKEYTHNTKREITFEYILAEGLNASDQDAYKLLNLLKNLQCKVNLIPLNAIPEFPYERPTEAQIQSFSSILNENGIRTTVRYSSGVDIGAACGQLRSVETKAQNKDHP